MECVKLLADMDPILLSSFSSLGEGGEEKNPFEVLSWYLRASNHNLKYLGLVGMAYVDQSFWKDDWIELLEDTIRDCYQDDTIITQAIENLDKIVDLNVLKLVTPGMIEALSRNYDVKSCNTTIAYWLINRIVEYHQVETDDEDNVWLVQSIVNILAETRKNLDDDNVETQCSLLRESKYHLGVLALWWASAPIFCQNDVINNNFLHMTTVLIGEVEQTKLRECSVNVTYGLLKKTNSDHFSPLFIQFAFWVK